MASKWRQIPLNNREWDFFDRQRLLFPKFMPTFDEDWRQMKYEDSMSRFNHDLERTRNELLKLDHDASHVQVHQPFVTDATGNKKMTIRFDCSEFKPEEISVKTRDNVLCVHAKHEEESPGKKKFVEFTKNYVLPDNVDPLKVKSVLSRDGVLHLEAPAPVTTHAPREWLIPIEQLEPSHTYKIPL